MNLNIIGNGFDLYHGLPCSYYYFGCYLIGKYPEFYEEIGRMYGFKYMKPVGPMIAHDYEYLVEDIFWRDFERHLGEVDEYFIVDTYEDDLMLENNDPVNITMDEDEIAERLKQYFIEWVRDTLDKDENFKIISNFLNNNTVTDKIDCDDFFLQFNYTHTLQKLYNISDNKIHFVHGECFGNEDDELIVGHGNNDRILEIKDRIERYEERYDYTQSSNNRINEYNCLLRYVERLRKDVNRHMLSCALFYDEIGNNFKKVNIFGLSMGDVDIPYLKQVREKWPTATWRFSYYSSEDKERVTDVATRILALNEGEYEIFRFCNTSSNQIREEKYKILRFIKHKN